MADVKTPQVSPFIPAMAAFTMLALIFLTLEASFLAREGKLVESTILGNAATAIVFFIVAGSLVLFAVMLGAIRLIKLSEVDLVSQTVGESARDFVLGFLVFYLIAAFAPAQSILDFSVLSAGDDPLNTAATISEPYWANFLTTLASPVAEEFLFSIGLPIILLMLLRNLASAANIKALSNTYVEYAIFGIGTAFAFAAFHIGKASLINFFIAAMVFRFILVMLRTDLRSDALKGVTAGWLFAIGGHMANNIAATGGLVKWFTLLAAPPTAFAVFTSIFTFLVIGGAFLLGLQQLGKQTIGRGLFS